MKLRIIVAALMVSSSTLLAALPTTAQAQRTVVTGGVRVVQPGPVGGVGVWRGGHGWSGAQVSGWRGPAWGWGAATWGPGVWGWSSAPVVVAPQVGGAWVLPPSAATVFIERTVESTAAPVQPAQQWWYWCASSRAYYPYVENCAESWQRVEPRTPPSTQ